MTPYSQDDLNQDWEFKILRCPWGQFGRREWRDKALNEEARAGWKLVEIFDDFRIRLKRPVGSSECDGQLDFDPYRTSVGLFRSPLQNAFIGGMFGLIAILAAALCFVLVNR